MLPLPFVPPLVLVVAVVDELPHRVLTYTLATTLPLCPLAAAVCLDYTRHYSHKCIGVRRNARNKVFQPLLFRKTYRWGADKYSAAGGRSAQC